MQSPFRNVQSPKNHGPRVLKGYTLNGYEIIVLENELLRVVVNVGRGAMVPEYLYKPADLDVMFKNPSGLRPHDTFTLSSYAEPPLRDHHPGGWYECFPSGSTPVTQEGAQIGFHGEIWGLPFELESAEDSDNECSAQMTAFTARTPWKLTKKFSLRKNDPTLYVEETATNLGHMDLTVMWGQHPFYGAPFIDGECRLEAAAKTVLDHGEKPMVARPWPTSKSGADLSRVGMPGSAKGKMIFLTDFTEGKYRIVSPTWKLALEMRWDARKFPFCWLYENCNELGAPWFGRAYGLAFEPFTGLPKAIEENKGVIRIAAHQSETVWFELRMAEAKS
jgi:galactose mutarotase-like enzyme